MQNITRKELTLVKNFIKIAEDKDLYGIEEELFKRLEDTCY